MTTLQTILTMGGALILCLGLFGLACDLRRWREGQYRPLTDTDRLGFYARVWARCPRRYLEAGTALHASEGVVQAHVGRCRRAQPGEVRDA